MKKGGIALYTMLAVIIASTVFSVYIQHKALTRTETPINNTSTQSKTTKPVFETTERLPENKLSTEELTENTEDIPIQENISEGMSLVDKITPTSEDIEKIKDLIENIIVPSQDTYAPPNSENVSFETSSTFTPNNDAYLERAGILYYTNIEREKENLAPLTENILLNEAAHEKMKHMFDGQYFEHIAPTGEDVSYWVDNTGYAYISVGENLARGGYRQEEKMVEDWMNSPGHRANIMKESFEEIGIAVGQGFYEGRQVWMGVQIFSIPLNACPAVSTDLLFSIESFQELIEEMGNTITSMHETISSLPEPATYEEFEQYTSMIDRYNTLIGKEQNLHNQLNAMIETYNKQVQNHNSCLKEKQ